jgi:hypothetical protein
MNFLETFYLRGDNLPVRLILITIKQIQQSLRFVASSSLLLRSNCTISLGVAGLCILVEDTFLKDQKKSSAGLIETLFAELHAFDARLCKLVKYCM